MHRFLQLLSKYTALTLSLTPIFLCFAVLADDMSLYYRRVIILAVVCGVTSVVSFVASELV